MPFKFFNRSSQKDKPKKTSASQEATAVPGKQNNEQNVNISECRTNSQSGSSSGETQRPVNDTKPQTISTENAVIPSIEDIKNCDSQTMQSSEIHNDLTKQTIEINRDVDMIQQTEQANAFKVLPNEIQALNVGKDHETKTNVTDPETVIDPEESKNSNGQEIKILKKDKSSYESLKSEISNQHTPEITKDSSLGPEDTAANVAETAIVTTEFNKVENPENSPDLSNELNVQNSHEINTRISEVSDGKSSTEISQMDRLQEDTLGNSPVQEEYQTHSLIQCENQPLPITEQLQKSILPLDVDGISLKVEGKTSTVVDSASLEEPNCDELTEETISEMGVFEQEGCEDVTTENYTPSISEPSQMSGNSDVLLEHDSVLPEKAIAAVEESEEVNDSMEEVAEQNMETTLITSSDNAQATVPESAIEPNNENVEKTCLTNDEFEMDTEPLESLTEYHETIESINDSSQVIPTETVEDIRKGSTASEVHPGEEVIVLDDNVIVVQDTFLKDEENGSYALNPETISMVSSEKVQTFEDIIDESSSVFTDSDDLGDGLPSTSEELYGKTPNWKVGYLHVKLPHKSKGRGKLKAWQKRWVVIQADEFTNDPKNCHVMLSIYHSESGNSRRHSALFYKSVNGKNAVLYRSSSRTHPYAFTIAEGETILVHLAAANESEAQEWMAAIRSILWPPSSVLQLEKVLNGNEFEVSIVDNAISFRAGLLGAYGFLTVTNSKLILTHTQTGHVIQEWYLNTIDKFQMPQTQEPDTKKILLMTTSKDSPTGCGTIRFFCNEAVEFLQAVASTIQKVLQYHSKGNTNQYKKEMQDLADWLTPQPSPTMSRSPLDEDYYKVPPRQVRSLLDIPNFIFDKPIQPGMVNEVLVSGSRKSAEIAQHEGLKTSTTCASNFSQDSGISVTTASEDILNCSLTSFAIGKKKLVLRGHSSSSESSDAYSPPHSPTTKRPTSIIVKQLNNEDGNRKLEKRPALTESQHDNRESSEDQASPAKQPNDETENTEAAKSQVSMGDQQEDNDEADVLVNEQ